MDWIAILNEALPALISALAVALAGGVTWLASKWGLGDAITQWRINELLEKALRWAANQIPGVNLKDPVTAEQGQMVVALAKTYVEQNAPKLADKVGTTLEQKLEARIEVKKDEAL